MTLTLNPIWPPPKRAKIKNKYDRGIIELKKVIFVFNSMFFEYDPFTCAIKNALRVHMTWNPIWPPLQRPNIKNTYDHGIIELKKVILVPNFKLFFYHFSMIYSLVH